MSLRDNLKVMVVDDMSVSRALISRSLDEIGLKQYVVETDAAVALGKLATSPVHLIISDMNMPGMDGLQMLEALRNNAMTQKIGFIMITGSATEEVLMKCQQLGANNLVRKPFTTASLKAGIQRVVGPL